MDGFFDKHDYIGGGLSNESECLWEEALCDLKNALASGDFDSGTGCFKHCLNYIEIIRKGNKVTLIGGYANEYEKAYRKTVPVSTDLDKMFDILYDLSDKAEEWCYEKENKDEEDED